jgi:polyhydroxyalkanoate synthesis regulator phasin
VEKTFQSTLGSATLTRERAQELADEVLRGAEKRAARAGRGVRDVGRNQREVAVGVGDRLREAITELRGARAEEVAVLRAELNELRSRIQQLEAALEPKKKGTAPSSRSRASGKSRNADRPGRKS